MTDKVQKIREEVEKIAKSINPFIPDEDGKNSDYEAGKLDAATQILQIIDSSEEPVSEELEDAADKYSQSIHSDYSNDMFDGNNIYDAVIYGAKWQMSQMMKDATEVTVHIDAGNYPYIPEMELYDYDNDVPLAKKGDKYKVVLIKEE